MLSICSVFNLVKTHIDQVTHTLEILVPPTVRAEPSDGNFVVRIVNPIHHHQHFLALNLLNLLDLTTLRAEPSDGNFVVVIRICFVTLSIYSS